MTRTDSSRRLIALALVAGFIAACGRDAGPGITGVVAPAARPAPASASRDRDALTPGAREIGNMTTGSWQQLFQASNCAPHGTISSQGVFGPAGGTLLFGNSRLIIPGGALRDTVTISAVVPEGTGTNVVFSPHGLQFEKAAGLVLSTESCELANPLAPAVVYLAPDGTVLEYIEAVFDPRWKTIAAPIGHFSGYAIAF